MESVFAEKGGPVAQASYVFITDEYIFLQFFIIKSNDAFVAPVFVELQALNDVAAILLDRKDLAILFKAFVEDPEGFINRLEVVQGILNYDPVETVWFWPVVEQVFVGACKEGSISKPAPVVNTFLYGIVIKFKCCAESFDAVHSQEKAGGTVAASSIPKGYCLLAGIGIDQVFLYIMEPL